MATWLREILNEANREVADWPAWKKEPEMSGKYKEQEASFDPDLVMSNIPECLTSTGRNASKE